MKTTALSVELIPTILISAPLSVMPAWPVQMQRPLLATSAELSCPPACVTLVTTAVFSKATQALRAKYALLVPYAALPLEQVNVPSIHHLPADQPMWLETGLCTSPAEYTC